MIFEQLSAGGCKSYLVGCAETCAAALIDPEIGLIDRYLGLAHARLHVTCGSRIGSAPAIRSSSAPRDALTFLAVTPTPSMTESGFPLRAGREP